MFTRRRLFKVFGTIGTFQMFFCLEKGSHKLARAPMFSLFVQKSSAEEVFEGSLIHFSSLLTLFWFLGGRFDYFESFSRKNPHFRRTKLQSICRTTAKTLLARIPPHKGEVRNLAASNSTNRYCSCIYIIIIFRFKSQ